MCDLGSLTLLILADQAPRRRALYALVRGFGIRKVHKAANTVQAVDILRQATIDIAIMDLALSPSNSIRTADFLTQSQGGNPNFVEVIVVRTESRGCAKCIFLSNAVLQFAPRSEEEAGLYEATAAAIERIADREIRRRVRLACDSRDEGRIVNRLP